MNWDIGDVWKFTRLRLAPTWEDLSELELGWRPSHRNHSIAEILMHIAGAEYYWACRFGIENQHSGFEDKLERSVKEGFLIDAKFPFEEDELNKEFIFEVLEFSRKCIEPFVLNPTEENLKIEMISPIGDKVTGKEGLIRLCQHAGYHAGQIWLMRMLPNFPSR